MDLNINYYNVLCLTKEANVVDIKKSYYKLSMTHHPDKGGDKYNFMLISEAYSVLSTNRDEYDIRSKWGRNYDEMSEFLDYEFSNAASGWDEDKLIKFKKQEALNLVYYIDDKFDGSIEYERWVICKSCNGSGRDLKSKIEIKDSNGKILRIFESEDGCDFCDGSGKDYNGNDCSFCFGQGKTGTKNCDSCKGEKRILGNQKLTGISFPKGEKDFKVECMGNFSKDNPGKVGHLFLVNKDYPPDDCVKDN